MENLMSKAQFESFASTIYGALSWIVASVVPTLMWEEPRNSVCALAIFWVMTCLLEYMSLTFMALLVLNAAFAYGKFETEVHDFLRPHVEMAKAKANDLSQHVEGLKGKLQQQENKNESDVDIGEQPASQVA